MKYKILFTIILSTLLLTTLVSAYGYYDNQPRYESSWGTSGSSSSSYEQQVSIYERNAREGYNSNGHYQTITTVREKTTVKDSNRYDYRDSSAYRPRVTRSYIGNPRSYWSGNTVYYYPSYHKGYGEENQYYTQNYYHPRYTDGYYDWKY